MPAPSVTYTLTNGTTADASQVMQNFNDLISGMSDGTKDFSINALTLAGALTANGHVTLGNASADDLTVNASLASSIPVKTDASYDIGTSSLGLRAIYFGGNSNRVNIRASGSMSATWTMTLPITAGTNNWPLVTNGSGVTSWGQITNDSVSASAAIVDTKLATISTAGKVSGTAITSGDISTSGSFTTTSNIVLSTAGGSYMGTTHTITDDSTLNCGAAPSQGIVLIGARAAGYSTVWGMFAYGLGSFCSIMTTNATMETSTSATSSAGITDGKVGVSAASGGLRVINRAGLTISVNVLFFGT